MQFLADDIQVAVDRPEYELLNVEFVRIDSLLQCRVRHPHVDAAFVISGDVVSVATGSCRPVACST